MNNKIRIAVCDDDSFYTEKLEKSLYEWFSVRKLTCRIITFASADRFFSKNTDFDLILLDIDMPGITGIEAAERLRKTDKNTSIVFITNLTSFVFEAIKFKPFRFIRKQFLETELSEMLEAFIKSKDCIFLDVIDENSRQLSIKANEVSYIEAFRHDISVHCGGRIYKADLTLNELENLLSDAGFIRIHKSFLVNCRFIYEINGGFAVTDDGERLAISRYRMKTVKDSFLKLTRSEIL
jgi:DNA-binding LytR/AlgR family response regulator